MKNITVILDPAHGADVKGKCSPDERHKEYLWSRDRCFSLKNTLTDLGYEVYMTTESMDEPGLSVRKEFATNIVKGRKKLLLSLHNNAAGSSNKWLQARGVEVYTTPGITDSDVCADIFLKHIAKDFPQFRIRMNEDSYLNRDKEQRFTVLMGAGYMGILVEWLFQDNKDDVEELLDDDINIKLESSIVAAIEEINDYFNNGT